MSSHQEKLLFSERLKESLLKANHPLSPTFLAKQFNFRYQGEAISVQSANNWLLGKAIPNQDKLSILAIWLNVSNQWLRFGDNDAITQQMLEPSNNTASNEDLNFFLKYKSLTNSQKQLIQNLIDEFTLL